MRGDRGQTRRDQRERKRTDILGTLLLSAEFFFLLNHLCLVFKREGKREAHEEGASGEHPDNVSNEFSSGGYRGDSTRNLVGDGRARGWGHDVYECGDAVKEGLFAEVVVAVIVGRDGGGKGVGRGRVGGGVGGCGVGVLVDDFFDFDHGGWW